MPSLFSRARTTSTPTKKSAFDLSAQDEFGRISSRGSARHAVQQHLVTAKKAGKRDGKSTPKGRSAVAEDEQQDYGPPDGTFLPLRLDKPRYESSDEPRQQEPPPPHDYGYLSYGRHVILGLDEVARLVDVVGEELGTRGLTTPFIFSTLALDVSAPAVKRLIHTFLNTCAKHSVEADRQWREEARLAGPHELGMTLRWGLARLVRWVGGHQVRGLVSYDAYSEWRDSEAALNYPGLHFSAFIDPLDPLLRSILVGLFTLLSRFAAHSASSGHTPPTLSPLFGPLLFGLGPSTLNFHHAYLHYLRAATATEHLILAFIRWQDTKASTTPALGVPTRLKAWIQGYPSMLPSITRQDRPQPRRGARTVRILSVRRNVRMYSPDLVKTAASWAQRPRGAVSNAGERAFAGSREWERIAPPTLKLPPRYSDAYKKRMDLPPNFHPDTGAGAATPPSLSSSISSASSVGSALFDEKEHGLTGGEDRFRSLTDLRWGEFEAMGFGSLVADEKKLQFDLTESARAARAAKRATLTWQDFSSSGFSRTDAHLSATLQFSAPVANQINAWPSQSAEMHRKLKKAQKALPPFGWDTEPVLGSEEVIEEAFVDVFCDLIYGGGWMDDERHEETDRECNWALVEFKSLPVTRTTTVSGTADPRTSTSLILFEEFVPAEYRQQLASAGANRRRLPSLFSGTTKSKWKPATTLNGRPYVVGHVPHSPSYREVEFEGLLRSNGSATKVISLNRSQEGERPPAALTSPSVIATPGHEVAVNPLAKVMSPASVSTPTKSASPQFLTPLRTDSPIPSPKLPSSPDSRSGSPMFKKSHRFRLPTGLPSSPAPPRRAGLPPTEYDPVEFDTRLASFDDEDPTTKKHNRRRSRDDAWVDILVANSSRRMAGQDAELRNVLKGGRSDPELASQEVSEVLAAVRGQFSDDEDDGMEPVAGPGGEGDTSTLQDSVLEHPPESSDAHGDDEDELATTTPRKRMGYFDLHPERRPPTVTDDPRDRFERPSLESDTSTENPYSASAVKTARTHLTAQDPGLNRVSTASEYDSDPEPVHIGSQSIPRDIHKTAGGKPLPGIAVSKTDDTPAVPAKSSASKTASLIEMYRERERSANSTSPIPSSRLPVRQASLQPPRPVGKDRSASPLPRTPSPSASPAPTDIPEIVEPEVEPADDKVSEDGIEIDIPTTYVHGAPLHNVLEEPEEEEA
ncbi:hypothetical protein BD413DRAFT_234537 [Trametes elegans]|nr:hypothetical protein BD413DRAFT_234537 [Trametes elegans]